MFELDGKVAVITGGTGVLGSVMAKNLAAAGASVAVLATTAQKTQALEHEIEAKGGKALGLVVDVLDRNTIESAGQAIEESFGQVDILVNAAGGNRPEATTSAERSFFDVPQDALEAVFNLNYLGTVIPSQVFGQIMARQETGTIINISSMASIQPLTRVLAYGGAKAAINNLTQWLAVHMAQEYSTNIRVNAIAPGFFLTEQNRFLVTDPETGGYSTRGQQIVDHTPMDRFGDPEDLVGTLLWLASDASRFVTGIVVPVDGGFSAYSGV